jgi:polysaccharide export outer membrane protein
MKMKSLHALLVLLVCCGPACAAQPDGAPVQPPVAGPGQYGEDSDYVLGPGDSVQVFVWNHPELSLTVPIRPDGKVSTPLVEDVVAVGQTASGLARIIEQRLAEFVRTPQVNVIVTDPQSANSKVNVIGQVRNAQAVPYYKGMTALDAVLAVGGLGEFAAGNRAVIYRKEAGGKQRTIRVKLADLVEKGRMDENVEMRPGDVLSVPQSRL